MKPHNWAESTLGHGVKMCSVCHMTMLEAAALGDLDRCMGVEEADFSRQLWLVTFENGDEYVCFGEEDVIMQFGESTEDNSYIVVKGTWTPEDN